MRQKRAKTYRKLMNMYSLTFGFRNPYQVLIDSQFCKALHDGNTDSQKQLSTVLQGNAKLMMTQCCIQELYDQEKEDAKAFQPIVALAKTLERRKCNHREAIPGDDCLTSVIGDANKHRYVVATQSSELRTTLRSIPAVPIIHITRSVLILEPPSDATLRRKQSIEDNSLHASSSSTPVVTPQVNTHKFQGPKAPNPLSVKKKTVHQDTVPLAQPKKRTLSELHKADIPSDISEEQKQILHNFLERHADFDTTDLRTEEDWTSLAEKIDAGELKKPRKRRR